MPSSLDEYEVLYKIGSGSYGTCKKIRRKKDGKLLVWKELDYGTMSETEKQMLVSEVNLLRELKHKHIVRYYDRIIDRSISTLYIIMEFCEGGDLATYINKTKKEGLTTEESFVWKICSQVSSALKECHCRSKNGKAVLHRDLKPANVFLDSSKNVKLGDFGLARVLNHDTSFAKTFVGTPYYMSPEQMNFMSYNEKSDVWSLGCLLYELCALRPPFTASNQRDLASRICVGHFQRLPLRYSDDLNDVIKYMLQVDEIKRPTIEKLMEHPIYIEHCLTDQQSSSTSSDEGYITKRNSLQKKEEKLQKIEKELLERERLLKVKEQEVADKERKVKDKERHIRLLEIDLQNRERNIILREKVADDRISRADKVVEKRRTKRDSGCKISPRSDASEADTHGSQDREPGELLDLELADSGMGCSVSTPKTGSQSPRSRRNSSNSKHRYSSLDDTKHVEKRGNGKATGGGGKERDVFKMASPRSQWLFGHKSTPPPSQRVHPASPPHSPYLGSPSLKCKIVCSPRSEHKAYQSAKSALNLAATRSSGKPSKRHPMGNINNIRLDSAGLLKPGSTDPKIQLNEKVMKLFKRSPPNTVKKVEALQPLLKKELKW